MPDNDSTISPQLQPAVPVTLQTSECILEDPPQQTQKHLLAERIPCTLPFLCGLSLQIHRKPAALHVNKIVVILFFICFVVAKGGQKVGKRPAKGSSIN